MMSRLSTISRWRSRSSRVGSDRWVAECTPSCNPDAAACVIACHATGLREGGRDRSRPPSRRPAAWHAITQAAASGLQLGVHSATHRSLPTLEDRDLQREIVESRDIIRHRTGVTPEFFAYPYGLWNDRVRQAVRAAGYRAAFTLDDGGDGATADRWAIPRVNVPAGIEDAAFQAWTAGLTLRRGRGS